jgi:hypothetical protein
MTAVDPTDLSNFFRLGWALAESRGRLLHSAPKTTSGARPEHALPLESERTWREQTIETREILQALADGLDLDRPLHELSRQGKGAKKGDTAMSRLRELEKHVAETETAHALGSALEFFYDWDERIQDILAPRSFELSSAYLLGRGLAESYWALHPDKPDSDQLGWGGFLFAEERLQALKRLLWALSGSFQPAPVDALPASLDAWARLAHDPDDAVRRHPLTYETLHTQIGVWHDVLLTRQPPQARVSSEDLVERARKMKPILRAFWQEAALGLLFLVVTVTGVVLFAVGGVAADFAPAVAVLGGIGITGAGTLASTKNQANSLFKELQTMMKADAVKAALTTAPADAYLTVAKGEKDAKEIRKQALAELAALPAA